MSLKKFKPITPSLRNTVLIDNSHLTKIKPLKSNLKGLMKKAGKNNRGKITSYHRGQGHKRSYREILWNRQNLNGIVEAIEYDPNRTAYIARIFCSETKKHFYILAPEGLTIGNSVSSGKDVPIRLGNALPLNKLPNGCLIHSISISNHSENNSFSRSAGTFSQIIQNYNDFCIVKLPSGEQRKVPGNYFGSIGIVSNLDNNRVNLGKAGRKRWLGRRPIVRGVAMNPVDHPHGGGEGKTSGGRPSVTPWGKPTKGKPTRRRQNKLILIRKS